MTLSREALESPVAFTKAVGVELYDWQADVLARGLRREHGRFVYPIVGISLPRGDGKTWTASGVGSWRFVCGRAPQHILSAALDYEGAKLTVRYARAFLRELIDRGEVVEGANGFQVPATGSVWEITSREHTASRGRHPTVVLYDELGWAQDDELFESLLSAQASVEDPLFLVTSTVGPRNAGPLWELAQRAASGDAAVFFEHSTLNRNPLVTPEYLDRMRRLKHPIQYAREHQNTWSEGEDAYVAAEWVDAAMGRGWEESELPEAGVVYCVFVDIGLVHDPTVIAIGHGDADGLVYIDRIVTHQGSRARPVDLGMLRAELASIAEVWQARVRIESWQGQAVAQDLVRGGIRADVKTPTSQSQAELWNTLAAELANGQVVLPRHDRLREELLGLRVELRAGGGIKVSDRGRLHQDHAIAVAGVVEMVVAGRRHWGPTRVLVPTGRLPTPDFGRERAVRASLESRVPVYDGGARASSPDSYAARVLLERYGGP